MLRFVSPASVVQFALEDVAGSGATRHQRFEDQVGAVHTQFQDFFFSRIEAGKRFTPEDYPVIPRVTFQEEPASALVLRVLWGLLSLLALVAALLAIAWPGLRTIGRLSR